MNAKQAVLFELGEFGENNPEAAVQDARDEGMEQETSEMDGLEESGQFEVDDNGNIAGFTFVEEPEEGEDASDAEAEVEGAGTEDESEDDDLADMSTDEINDCIEATSEAMNDRHMNKEMFDWGLGYLDKLFAAKNKKLRAQIDAIDWDEVKARWAREEEEEVAREKAEKERFLKT